MANRLIPAIEIDHHQTGLGHKALNLKKCLDWGLPVPDFVAWPANACRELYEKPVLRTEVAAQAVARLGAGRYAVRSSALIEDGAHQSFAGQFTTRLNLSATEIAAALYEVLDQANTFLGGKLDKFSLIIQKYLPADMAGITFTRNPHGSREMILEYAAGSGEQIASGRLTPRRISFYWSETAVPLPAGLRKNQAIEKFQLLENKFGQPQDIEWCLTDGRFYILQARPITTISPAQYQHILFTEKQIPASPEYFWEKTEISEIAPRPTPITLDLLRMIYTPNGPVARVYRRYSVTFHPTDFLRICGNELLIDKEQEIQGLLPAFSYLNNKSFKPRFHSLGKLWITVKNLFYLNIIPTKDHEQLFRALASRLEETETINDLAPALDGFIRDYELIFNINLLSGLSLKKLEILLKGQPIKLPDILNYPDIFSENRIYHLAPPPDLIGNSLEIADESAFLSVLPTTKATDNPVSAWWHGLPDFRRKIFLTKIREAIIYNRLREYGRWLTVKNITIIRSIIIDRAKQQNFTAPDSIYFAHLAEITSGSVREVICQERRNSYQSYNNYFLPSSLTSTFINASAALTGVSAGLAEGILRTPQDLETRENGTGKIILYTEILSPDLTRFFDRISGIIAARGGLLSHLAIIAREKNIPVVVGSTDAFQPGDRVRINGSIGTIERINR